MGGLDSGSGGSGSGNGSGPSSSSSSSLAKPPLRLYAMLSLLIVTTMGLSNAANAHLSYPVKVMFKSAKIIPVMLLGVAYFGKAYAPAQYGAAVLLCVGLATISVANSKAALYLDYVGLAMVLCSMMADAAIGNLQQRTLQAAGSKGGGGDGGGGGRDHHCSPSPSSSTLNSSYSPPPSSSPPPSLTPFEAMATVQFDLMYYQSAMGTGYLLVVCGLVTGELWPGLQWSLGVRGGAAAAWALNTRMLLFAVLGCVGQAAVVTLIKEFGIFATTVVTTSRQFVTIVFSFLLFPKPFSATHLLACLLYLAGLALNLHHRRQTEGGGGAGTGGGGGSGIGSSSSSSSSSKGGLFGSWRSGRGATRAEQLV